MASNIWMIRVTDKDGHDTVLRHGSMPGRGDIVRFRSKEKALAQVEQIRPGLDAGDTIAVVPYDHVWAMRSV